MAVEDALRRFTVDDYYRMARAGILRPDERVELLDGRIVAMSPMGSRHAHVVSNADHLLDRALGRRAVVRTRLPVRLGDFSEPEPDLAVVRARPGYAEAHPKADDVLLLIEVADSTAGYDRREKLHLYAQSGIAEVWIVNLAHRGGPVVEVYREPSGESYTNTSIVQRHGTIVLRCFPDVEISLDEMFGEL